MASVPWVTLLDGCCRLPWTGGAPGGRHAQGLLDAESSPGSGCRDAAVAPLARDPVPIPKLDAPCVHCQGCARAGPGTVSVTSWLGAGPKPACLGWEKPLHQGHLPGDRRLSEPHEPLSCHGTDARHLGSQAPATARTEELGWGPAHLVPVTAPGQVGNQPSVCHGGAKSKLPFGSGQPRCAGARDSWLWAGSTSPGAFVPVSSMLLSCPVQVSRGRSH